GCVWSAADDVCDAGCLSALNDWRRQFPLAHPGKPNDADRRDLPLRLSRQRHARRDVSLLHRRLHSGRPVYWRCSFQPRRAYLHGHGVGQGESGEWKAENGKKKVESGNEKVWEPEARRWQKGETYDVRRFGGMAAGPAISQRNLQFDARE